MSASFSAEDLFAPSAETRRLSVPLSVKDLEGYPLSDEQKKSYLQLRRRFLEKPVAQWDRVTAPPENFFHSFESFKDHAVSRERAKELLEKLVVIQLNGGLGTMMGCKGPKSAIEIFKKARSTTIFEVKVQQIEELNKEYDVNIPLVFMNSQSTEHDTEVLINRQKGRQVDIYSFTQSMYPLMFKDTMTPVGPEFSKSMYYPPGSGEIFTSFLESGLLDKFREMGKEYLFISNVENLGASVNEILLNHFASSQLDFMLEVTNRISTDFVGGIPILYTDERVHILEMSQVPSDKLKQFSALNYKYWNTNNIWTRLTAVKNQVRLGALELDFTVKERRTNGRSLIQVETPASMAIHSFKRAAALLVPRSRFRPVKTTSHLLYVQSDLFAVNEKGLLVMNPKREPPIPNIKLGEEFKELSDYEKRFKTIPSLLELDHLTVSGDVYFGANVTLKGTVIIVADTGSRVDIPDGAVIENKIISGELILQDY